LAAALNTLAFVGAAAVGVAAATRVLEESLSLFRSVEHEPGVAQVLVLLVIGDAQAGEWERVATRIEEVVAIWRRLGNPYHLANDLVWLAVAYARLERWDEARSAGLEALGLFRDADSPTGISLAFRCLAFLATWAGRHEDAIRLVAASEALDERAGAGRTTGFAGLLEGDPADEAAAHLPEEAARRAREEGRSMSVDDAVALAEGPGRS
jgi:hypothetical protein